MAATPDLGLEEDAHGVERRQFIIEPDTYITLSRFHNKANDTRAYRRWLYRYGEYVTSRREAGVFHLDERFRKDRQIYEHGEQELQHQKRMLKQFADRAQELLDRATRALEFAMEGYNSYIKRGLTSVPGFEESESSGHTLTREQRLAILQYIDIHYRSDTDHVMRIYDAQATEAEDKITEMNQISAEYDAYLHQEAEEAAAEQRLREIKRANKLRSPSTPSRGSSRSRSRSRSRERPMPTGPKPVGGDDRDTSLEDMMNSMRIAQPGASRTAASAPETLARLERDISRYSAARSAAEDQKRTLTDQLVVALERRKRLATAGRDTSADVDAIQAETEDILDRLDVLNNEIERHHTSEQQALMMWRETARRLQRDKENVAHTLGRRPRSRSHSSDDPLKAGALASSGGTLAPLPTASVRQWMIGLACPSLQLDSGGNGDGGGGSATSPLRAQGHGTRVDGDCADYVTVPVDVCVTLLAMHKVRLGGERDYVARIQVHNRPAIAGPLAVSARRGKKVHTKGGGGGGKGKYSGSMSIKTCGNAGEDTPCLQGQDLHDVMQYATERYPCVDYPLQSECAAGSSHGCVDTHIGVDLSVPCRLAPDACVSVTLFATRNAEHDAPAPATETATGQADSLLQTAVGRYMQIGSVLFPLRQLLHLAPPANEDSARAPTSAPAMRGEVYPIGREMCCESVDYRPQEARARVTARLRHHTDDAYHSSDLRSRIAVLDASGFGGIDILSETSRLEELTRRLEEEETQNRSLIRSSASCPEAVRCYMRAVREKDILIPGFTFVFEPSPLDPRNLSEATIQGLFHMALVYREIKEQTLAHVYRDGRVLSTLQKNLLAVLEARPWAISCTTLFEVELARITGIRSPSDRSYACLVLVAQAITGVTKYATYVSDEQVCRVCRRNARADILAGSGKNTDDDDDDDNDPVTVSSDAYSDFVGGPCGYRGDCDDLQKFIVETYNLIVRWPGGAFGTTLLNFVRDAMQHYHCFTAVGTAHAAKAGETQADIDAGGTDDAGVRRGIQGHMYAVILGDEDALVLEGTTTYDPQHRLDVDPRPMRVLVQDLLRVGDLRKQDLLVRLGINADAVYGFRPQNPKQEFYDCLATVCGTVLHEVVDDTPRGDGRRVTSAAVTYADPLSGGQQRIGVPMGLLLERGGIKKHGIQLANVGFCDDATLGLLVSLGVMTTAKLFPPNATSRRKAVSSELTPSEARLRQNINEGAGVVAPLLGSGSAYIAAACKIIAEAGEASVALAKRLAAAGTKIRRLVALKFRADRTNERWAREMVSVMEQCSHVVSLSAYMDVVFDDLQGVVVVAGVVVEGAT